MVRTTSTFLTALLLSVSLAGCESAEERAARLQAERDSTVREARADSVAEAAAQYDPAAFDSIAWEDADARFERGRVVWSFSCAKCHGGDGKGGGEMAVDHDLAMPDLAGEWALAGDVAGIRRAVYVGHETEMPSWGLYGLTYRDVDAVAYYIEEGLRSESSEP